MCTSIEQTAGICRRVAHLLFAHLPTHSPTYHAPHSINPSTRHQAPASVAFCRDHPFTLRQFLCSVMIRSEISRIVSAVQQLAHRPAGFRYPSRRQRPSCMPPAAYPAARPSARRSHAPRPHARISANLARPLTQGLPQSGFIGGGHQQRM